MDEYIESLRNRPLQHRQMISLAGAATVTTVIGLVWGITLVNNDSLDFIDSATAQSQAAAAAQWEAREGRQVMLEGLQAQFGGLEVESGLPYAEPSNVPAFDDATMQYQDPNAKLPGDASDPSAFAPNGL